MAISTLVKVPTGHVMAIKTSNAVLVVTLLRHRRLNQNIAMLVVVPQVFARIFLNHVPTVTMIPVNHQTGHAQAARTFSAVSKVRHHHLHLAGARLVVNTEPAATPRKGVHEDISILELDPTGLARATKIPNAAFRGTHQRPQTRAFHPVSVK